MATPDASGALTALLVLGTLVLTGPLVGLAAVPAEPTTERLGSGNVTVTGVDFEADALRIDRGRFGAGVAYLRIPPMNVELDDVRGNPRLVYVVRVPELDFERVATTLLANDGLTDASVEMSDRAYDPATLEADSYRATVALRVQSFTVDRTVLRRNVTVEVTTNG